MERYWIASADFVKNIVEESKVEVQTVNCIIYHGPVDTKVSLIDFHIYILSEAWGQESRLF